MNEMKTESESRRKLKKFWRREGLKVALDIAPGMPEYQNFASDLMPLEISLGNEPESYSDVCWRPGDEQNGFITVLGASGSGKTESLKLIGKQIIEHGIPLVTIDFHGDLQFEGQNTLNLNGGPSNQAGINPLAFDNRVVSVIGIRGKVEREVERISLAVGKLSVNQYACLTDAMMHVYKMAGITDASIGRWDYAFPKLTEVMYLLEQRRAKKVEVLECYDLSVITACYVKVSRLAHLSVFNHRYSPSPIEMKRKNLRFNCRDLESASRALVAETILQMIFEEEKGSGPIPVGCVNDADRFRVFVMLDEAKILTLSKRDPDRSDHILNIIATEGRKYGIGLIVATQMNSHFGCELKANTASSLCMLGMDDKEAKVNARALGVPEDVLRAKGNPGEGYFKTKKMDTPVKVSMDRS